MARSEIPPAGRSSPMVHGWPIEAPIEPVMPSATTIKRISGPTQVLEPEASSSQRSWRLMLSPLIPILMVYFCLAFYRIDHQSLWVDEVRSLESADPAGSLLTRDILFRGQGPLYFMMLHFWAKFSTSEAFLRALSALLGGLAVALVYATGLRVGNRRLASIGAILFATSPFLIWYSQEVRYVVLVIAVDLLAMAIFTQAIMARRAGWWLLYCGSLVLAIGTSPLNVFLVMGQGLYLFWSPLRRPDLRKWLVCQLMLVALFVWWANAGHMTQVGGYWQRLWVYFTSSVERRPSPEGIEPLATGSSREFSAMALPYTFFTFSTGFSLGPSLQELHVSRSLATLLPHAFTLSISGLVFGSLFLLGVVTLWHRPEMGKFLSAWLAVPIIAVFTISWLIPSLSYNVRYVAMSLPAYSLILASGIGWFKRPFMQMAFVVAVLLINGFSLANYYFNSRYSREDARSAVQFLRGMAQPEHPILVVGNEEALEYYARGGLPLVNWGQAVINDQSALIDHLHQLNQQQHQLWLVTIRSWEEDPKGTVKGILDARHRLIEHHAFPGIDIYAYRLD